MKRRKTRSRKQQDDDGGGGERRNRWRRKRRMRRRRRLWIDLYMIRDHSLITTRGGQQIRRMNASNFSVPPM